VCGNGFLPLGRCRLFFVAFAAFFVGTFPCDIGLNGCRSPVAGIHSAAAAVPAGIAPKKVSVLCNRLKQHTRTTDSTRIQSTSRAGESVMHCPKAFRDPPTALWLAAALAALLTASLPATRVRAQTAESVAEAVEDSVRTKAGTTFHGKIVSEDGEKVVIETRSGRVEIPRVVVEEIRKAGIDYRAASEKIDVPQIRPEEAPEYVKKARTHADKGEMKQAAAICEGLLGLPGGTLSSDQRVQVGTTMGEAYFELKDWPAAARGMRKATVAVTVETDRDRMLAVAEALEAHQVPSIGGQSVENFAQAQQAAMKWKAGEIFNYAKQYVDETKEINRRSSIERAMEVSRIRLARSETYVPGYSIVRAPDLAKAMVDRLMDAVGKAQAHLVERRKELVRGYVGGVTTRERAELWNKDCQIYLDILEGAAGCLNNVRYLGEQYPDAGFFDAKAHEQQKQTVYDLQFYENDISIGGRRIELKGKKIALMKIGGN